MAPRIPPKPPGKPTIGPLVRRSLFVATLGVAACGSDQRRHNMRIGPPPRIGAEIEPFQDPPEDPSIQPIEQVDDAGVPSATSADAAVAVPEGPVRIGPPPIRIGPPVRDWEREKLDPPDDDIRIGAMDEPDGMSTHLRGIAVDGAGTPLAGVSLRVDVGGISRIVTTDGVGTFVVDGVSPGEHRAEISAPGRAPVQVTLTASRRADAAVIALGGE